MARNRRARRTPPKRPDAPKTTKNSSLAEMVSQGMTSATVELGSEAIPSAQPADPPHSEKDLADLWQQATQVTRAYQDAVKGLGRREGAVTAREEEIVRRREQLDAEALAFDMRRHELAEAESALEQERESLSERAAALNGRDRTLLDRESALAVREEREKELIIAEARTELAAARKRFDTARHDFDEEIARQQSRLREELSAERERLVSQRAELAEEWRRIRHQKVEMQAREEDLQDTKELYAERTTLAVSSATEQIRAEAEHRRRLYEAARDDADMHSRRIAEYERLDRAFGSQSPVDALAELERLREESAELRRLRLSAPGEQTLRLAALEEETRQLRDRCITYAAHNERLQRQLSAHEITAVEVERLSVSKEALEAEVRAYREQVEEQKRDWQGLVERREGETAFAACSAMDEKYDTAPGDLAEMAPPLNELVAHIRAFIRQQHGLFYEMADLRSFLGGLAATQLHLLEGISGIGKTQLPQRFAEAIGATTKVVSVGADWRTPQDLMGYYNAFERRFYESEFTKALYQAQCPRFSAQPFFIVLDEMNLSHPEQYFNDVLSALSREVSRESRPDLVLMSSAVEPSPRLLREGRLLPVPKTVFFVGTANQDETTLLFADKTYDRANLIELPATYERFTVPPQGSIEPLSWKALETAFDAAEVAHERDAHKAAEFLASTLADRMATDFQISWGGRLSAQLSRYVPVVMASGGSLSEATDQLVARKILRKLQGRYEVRVDHLKQLREDLGVKWQKLSADGTPDRSVAALDSIIRKLGHE
ncbi:AAA family ATPase [Streptomyces sp. NPDC017524]|uniref:AAA family ATPase n=1 Tax=Streptomyces sp. NPDC017524 TaxID=3364999 RepID=UPI00379DFA77